MANKIQKMKIGESFDWKFGLCTRTIERVSACYYLIHDFSDGWITARITLATVNKLIKGKKSLLDLNWY